MDDYYVPTPKSRRRRLGLGRWFSTNNVITTPGTGHVLGHEPSTALDIANTPCDLNTSNNQTITKTPTEDRSTLQLGPRRALSTNSCRPYYLSLNRRLRTEVTKKRLQFQLANGKPDTNDTNNLEETKERIQIAPLNVQKYQSNDGCLELGERTKKALKPEGNQPETSSLELVKDTKKVAELKESIGIWKNGFVATMRDLQDSIEPRCSMSDLLTQLGLPLRLLKYLEEE